MANPTSNNHATAVNKSDPGTIDLIVHRGSAILLASALIAMTAAGRIQAFEYALPLPFDFAVGLLDGPRNLDENPGIPTPTIVVFNNGHPYLGSVMGTPGPDSEIDYRDWGIYYRQFTWQSGEYWITLAVSLWWPILASALVPLCSLTWRQRLRFSIKSWLLLIAVQVSLMNFAPGTYATHPASVIMNMSMTVAAFSLIRMLAWGVRGKTPSVRRE